MANPDWIDYGAEQDGTGVIVVNAAGSWNQDDILVVLVATDGWTPSLLVANGYVLAQDPLGNTGSVNHSIGVAGMHMFWKRAAGAKILGLDLQPTLNAPSGGGTVQCLHTNVYRGCRTTGTPFHVIATGIAATTTTAGGPGITTTLAACTVVTVAASETDDTLFASWNCPSAASPSGTLDSGWHTNLGNACSFAGGRGGFATAGGPRSADSVFGATTRQAQITFALASLDEVSGAPDDIGLTSVRPPEILQPQRARSAPDVDAPLAVPFPIGAAGVAQRIFAVGPNTGTLTAGAVPPLLRSTAYVLDPTGGGINRAHKDGNIYQCRTAGTTSASEVTLGTGTDVTDGSAHWTYIGPLTTGSNTVAGSQVLIATMRGLESAASPAAPTDNDSGSYTAVELHAYASFPDSVAAVYRRTTAANLKVGFTASSNWGESAGSGDEITVAVVELKNAAVGAPHAQGQVERATATSGVVTGPSVVATKRCWWVSFWFGNAPVLTAGTDHVATPMDDLVLVTAATALKSLSTNGYIQVAVAVTNRPAGTYADRWTTGAGASEGAQIVSVAFEDTTTISVEDSQALWMFPPPPSWLVRLPIFADDQIVVQVVTIVDDDAPRWSQALTAPWASQPQRSDEEFFPVSAIDEDYSISVMPRPPEWAIRFRAVDDDLASVLLFDEEQPARPVIWPAVPVLFAPQVDDDPAIAAAVTIVDDDASWTGPRAADAWPVWRLAQDDDLPVAAVASIVDDDAGSAPRPWRVSSWVSISIDEDLPPGTIAPDDDAATVSLTRQSDGWSAVMRSVSASDEELPQPVIDDEPVRSAATWRIDWNVAPRPGTDDELPEVAVTALDDDGWTSGRQAVPHQYHTSAQVQDEDFPIADPLAGIIEEDIGRSPHRWPLAWTVTRSPLDDAMGDLFAPADGGTFPHHTRVVHNAIAARIRRTGAAVKVR